MRKPQHDYRVEGDTAYIRIVRLGHQYEALVDVEDLQRVLQYRWNINSQGYARCSVPLKEGKRGTIFMHHVVLPRRSGYVNDHINRIRLDNRKSNLRYCTSLENSRNTNVRKDSTTGLKGVLALGGKRGFTGTIQIKGKRIHLGVFNTPQEAHEAYLKAVKKYH